MMFVVGCDYSSHYVDIVRVPYDFDGAPVWLRFGLVGSDAFERARNVASAMPGPASSCWDDVLGWGIEDPRGQNAGALYRVQGAILAQLPARMLVEKWVPSRWRKAVGLPGNATKAQIQAHVITNHLDFPLHPDNDPGVMWPQDAFDAYCIALATRDAITVGKAA